MPAPSRAMQQASAIAEHQPEKLYKRNRSLLGMTKGQLHDYASTPSGNLPEHSDKSGALKSTFKKPHYGLGRY